MGIVSNGHKMYLCRTNLTSPGRLKVVGNAERTHAWRILMRLVMSKNIFQSLFNKIIK